MGKVSNRSTLVSSRRRVLKASSGVGVKKNRGSAAKGCLPAPPQPITSLVDEDSGFGGDQSLDSESSVLSSPGNSNSGGGSILSVLPSLAMVPQTKLLLVSLLQGAGDEQGTGTSQKNAGNVAVGAFTPTTQLTISNGTSQTGNTQGAVTSSGADKEWHTPHSVGTLVANSSGSFSLQGTPCTEVVSKLPSVSTNSPSNYPSGIVPLGNTSHKGVYSQVNIAGSRLPVDVSGEEAQELPGSLGNKARQVPPLISFRDVSLLSSIHSIRSNTTTGNTTSVVRVEGAPAPSNRSKKVQRQTAVTHSPPPLNAQLSCRSSDGSMELKLINQPEEQHRARYQTEGSRGAVKDVEGKGHPTVKLVGFSKPTVIQIFVGDDSTRTSPHMFYQVCRVSGKNSTPCKERRIDGTAAIEALLEPSSDMVMSCDCVGILKERNVDVEHRFKAVVSRGRKKSTKCRLVFRTFVTLPNGTQETLQVVSRAIACTQPPGVPEICRKSLSSCRVTGGEEVFIFGKNFSKDTVVIFQETGAKSQPVWEQTVIPEKETLQPIHLIVTVPKYYDEMITDEVVVQMIVSSGSKMSEAHNFTYMPIVTKKEVQGQEIPEEQSLPKGVSLGALQVNRHYAETRMLPSSLQEVSTTTKFSNSPVKMVSVPVTKSVLTSGRVSRVVQSSANRKLTGRTQRSASQVTKNSLVVNKTTGLVGGVLPKQISNASCPKFAALKLKSDLEGEKNTSKLDQKPEVGKGTVSLGSLVELLNVVQSLPTGSIEELVKSMKENITTPSSVSSKTDIHQESLDVAQEIGAAGNSVSLANILQGKIQKCSTQPSLLVSQDVSSKIIPAVTTNLGLWPLTLFPSVTTSQSVAGGPRVARVAPIAPTTVVSSPGLARTLRVCVAESPNISVEPPKKKPCDHVTSMDYEIVGSNQMVSRAVVNSNVSPITSQQSPEITFNPPGQAAPVTEVITSQGDSPSEVSVSSCSNSQEPTFIHSTSQIVPETTAPVLGSTVQTTLSPQQPLYQTITPTLLQSINEAPQQVSQPLGVNVGINQAPTINQPLNVSLGQSIQQVSHPLTVPMSHSTQEVNQSIAVTLHQNIQEVNQPLNVTCLSAAAPEVNQVVIKAEPQVINQRSSPQEINIAPAPPTSRASSLFNQPTDLGTPQMVVGNHPVISSSASNQAPTLTPQPVVSSALTHSDPLLSQSVAPMQMDQSGATPEASQRNLPAVEPRPRAEGLMTPSSTATSVSMQNEVTSAINLSETELLNYFDPNCFDNV